MYRANVSVDELLTRYRRSMFSIIY